MRLIAAIKEEDTKIMRLSEQQNYEEVLRSDHPFCLVFNPVCGSTAVLYRVESLQIPLSNDQYPSIDMSCNAFLTDFEIQQIEGFLKGLFGEK